MWVFNSLFGKLFDGLFFFFRSMSPWISMIIVSALTGMLMLAIFRLTSNQEGIKKTKNKIKAHILELRLFQDNLGISLRAQRKILTTNLKYLSHTAKPMLIMIVPLILVLIQLNFRFAYLPFQAGQQAMVKVILNPDVNPAETEVELTPLSTGIKVETPGLRIEEEREIDWRIRITGEGRQEIAIESGSHKVIKRLDAGGTSLRTLSPVKVGSGFFDQLFYPAEKPMSSTLPFKSVTVSYPERRMNLFGWKMHWIIAYFILSMIFGFGLKGVFRVDF